MSKVISFLILFIPLVVQGQQNLLFQQIDTLKYDYRTGGTGIDSLDWYNTGNFTLNPGGAWNNPFGTFGSDYLNIISSFQNPLQLPKPVTSKFIALPHLGFSYSFGSKGLQYLKAEYQQTFKKNTHLNVLYSRNSNGAERSFMRNNSFSNDAFQFLIDHQGKRYDNLIYLNFIKSNRSLSGGIRTDTLIETFGLEFSPVYKGNAQSKQKNFKFGSQHAFNVGKDSIVKHGFVYKNQWSIQNRVYTENDTLYVIYNHVYIDSNETRDQYQLARINNAGGYFFKSKTFSAEVLLQHGYWKFQNLATNRDTNEIEFQGNIVYQLQKFRLTNVLRFNLAGALGEWENNAHAQLKLTKWNHFLNFKMSQSLPTPFQRQYFANNHSWKISNLETQGQTTLNYKIQDKSKFDVTGELGWKQLNKTYFLIDSTWRNDTLSNLNLFSASVRGTLNWKTLYWQPQVIVTSSPDDFAFIPQFDLRSKFFFNKRLFKAKKLNFIMGVDLRYQANYKLLAYDPSLDLYRLPNQHQEHKAMLELDFFTGFQIDDFRFYFKFENIDYFWNPQTNLQQLGYPVSPNVIRLGLTWDFFN